jgi:hypothetical protein
MTTTVTAPAYNKQAVLKLALALVKVIRREMIRRDEEYRAECIQSYKDGYAPHYCKHGVNMWVDYDCACWQCEVGDDDLENAPEIALREARQAIKECQSRKDKTWDAAMSISKTDWKLTMQMLDYMLAPMTNLLKEYKIEGHPVPDVFLPHV